MDITYNHFHEDKDSSRLLNLLSRAENYEGEYEESEHKGNTIFFAKSKTTTPTNKTTWYVFFGLVDSNNSNQSLRYSYNVKCEELDGDCSYDFDAIEQEVKDIMKSVKFKDVELEEGEN